MSASNFNLKSLSVSNMQEEDSTLLKMSMTASQEAW